MSDYLKAYDALYRKNEELYHHAASCIGLSYSAFLVLYGLVALGDGCSQTAIANYYFISKTTVSSAVRTLVDAGYLLLQKAEKGRQLELVLTDSGRRFTDRFIRPIYHLEKAAFSALSLSEQAELVRLSSKYLSAFEQGLNQLIDQGDPTP